MSRLVLWLLIKWVDSDIELVSDQIARAQLSLCELETRRAQLYMRQLELSHE